MSTLQDLDGPRLDVPSTDDLMHLSPDMDRLESADEDIDIDFDIDNDVPGNPEDEAMEEQFDNGADPAFDGHPQSTSANDDEMFNDDLTDAIQPDRISLVDEHLEDAESPLLDDEDVGVQPSIIQNPQTESSLDPHSVSIESIAQSNNVEIQDYGANLPQDLSDGTELVDEPSSNYAIDTAHTRNTHNANNSDESLRKEPQQQSVQQDDQNEETAPSLGQGVAIHDQHTPSKMPNAGVQSSHRSYISTTGVDLDDQSQSYGANNNGNEIGPDTDTQPLHPIIVVYQGNEMLLFPPIDQDTEQSQTYFLDSETYAAQSLGDLFGHCRSVLGDSISDEEELEIKISDLGLTITETSNDFPTSTLSQVLDIFLQLSHHDGLENPDPMYIELCTKYKTAQRLEYLMNAVIDGKGFSQLKYIDGAEGFNGDGEYAQEDEASAIEDSEGANNATALEAGQSFNFSGKHTLEGNDSVTDRLESEIHQEKITQPLPNLTETSLQHSSDRSTEITGKMISQGDITPTKESTKKQPEEINTKHEDHIRIEDDMIDFSDEEVIPEVSARSSTLQGDDRLDERKRDSPGSRHDPEELIDYGDEEEPNTGIDSADAIFNDSNSEQREQGLNEGFTHTTRVSHEDQVQHNQSLDEEDDLDHIVDYGGEEFQGGSTYQEYEDGALEEETTLDLVADTAQAGDSEQVKSVATPKHNPTQALTSDIDFGDDLEEEVRDVAKAATIDISHTAPRKDNHTVDLAGFNANAMTGARNGQGTQTEQKTYSIKTSQDHTGLNDDTEDFLIDSDDEITLPDQIEPVPKFAVTPPSLKRLRDSHDEGNVPSATSPDMKRIRST